MATELEFIRNLLDEERKKNQYLLIQNKNLLSECERLEKEILLWKESNDNWIIKIQEYFSRIKELEEGFEMYKFGWNEALEKVRELEERIQLAESTRDDALAYKKMYETRVRELEGEIEKHKFYIWGDGIVKHPADRELYKLIEKEMNEKEN